MIRHLKVVVVCGGKSSEHKVSLKTAEMVLKNLNPRKYKTFLAVIEKNGKWKFGSGRAIEIGNAIEKLKNFDFVFIAMHGVYGEDGRFQALLEWIDIPYSGSGVLSSAMTMDKEVSNVLYAVNGLKVPRYVIFDKSSQDKKLGMRLPVVIKPTEGGSSVGVSIIKSKKGLQTGLGKASKEGNRIMIQEYIKGREFTCGVLEDEAGKPFALPPTEIIPKTSSFFDYGAKYKIGGSLEITPARLPKTKTRELQRLALKAHKILNCNGMSRSDFILKNSRFYILETNTIPGMTETSLLPQAAKVAGIDFPSLLDTIIAAGLRKNSI